MNIEEQLQLKLKFERELQISLDKIFNDTIQANKRMINEFGFPIGADQQHNEIKDTLIKHYQMVIAAFLGVALNEVVLDKHWFDNWTYDTVDNSTNIIIRTTNRNIADSIIALREEAREENKVISNRELAIGTGLLLASRFNKRKETIALAETQTPAEAAKFEEARFFNNTQAYEIDKTWITKDDSKVRSSHKVLHNLTIPIDEKFKVPLMDNKGNLIGGHAEMDCPGDRNAPINLWIRCRCHLSFSKRKL